MFLPGAAAEGGVFFSFFKKRPTEGCMEGVPVYSLLLLSTLSFAWCLRLPRRATRDPRTRNVPTQRAPAQLSGAAV